MVRIDRVTVTRETLNVSNTAIGLTDSLVTAQVDYALFVVVGNAVRVTTDGTTPVGGGTSGTGQYYAAGSTFEIWGHKDLKAFQVIRDSADADVDITYFGRGSA